RTGLFVGGAVTVLLAGTGAWFLAALALRPVDRMRKQAATISEHDADRRLPIPRTHDEIAHLGTTMNALLERLQGALAQQRAFVADASHELRTPLAVLRTELELAGRPERDLTELRGAIAEAAIETERLCQLTDELLFLARHDEQRIGRTKELQPIWPLLDRAATSARTYASTSGITIHLDADRSLIAPVVLDDLRRAIDNLLTNAVRHAPAGSTIELSASTVPEQLCIVVRDHGPGFPPEFIPHAFERFRRGDTVRNRNDGGSGLGLAIVRAVVREHGGVVEAANHPDGGAEIRVRLPLAP
ncbi:MAG: ATP-binding protein, partial [Acidimicrobiia bacterium]